MWLTDIKLPEQEILTEPGGKYCIVYEIHDATMLVLVVNIDRRKDVYR